MSSSKIQVVKLEAEHSLRIEGAATLLNIGFRELSPESWADMDSAREEILDLLKPNNLALVAINARGQVLGFVGGLPEYDGHVYELHPLVVHPEHQRQGIGRTLVAALERTVADQGAHTIMLGTDDEVGWTSLGGRDLYPNIWEQIRDIQNPGGHPYSFYQKIGYQIVGLVPDANGFGKPDILMAKRVARNE
jgi:aminoglycoside 6'-N-acetyltransferase I